MLGLGGGENPLSGGVAGGGERMLVNGQWEKRVDDDWLVCGSSGNIQWNPKYFFPDGRPKNINQNDYTIVVGAGGTSTTGELVMKPFNLAEAVEGARICTSLGTEIILVYYDKYSEYLIVKTSQNARPYTVSLQEAQNNIFMKPTKVTKYMNVYRNAAGDLTGTYKLHDTKENAHKGKREVFGAEYATTVSFEVEE